MPGRHLLRRSLHPNAPSSRPTRAEGALLVCEAERGFLVFAVVTGLGIAALAMLCLYLLLLIEGHLS